MAFATLLATQTIGAGGTGASVPTGYAASGVEVMIVVESTPADIIGIAGGVSMLDSASAVRAIGLIGTLQTIIYTGFYSTSASNFDSLVVSNLSNKSIVARTYAINPAAIGAQYSSGNNNSQDNMVTFNKEEVAALVNLVFPKRIVALIPWTFQVPVDNTTATLDDTKFCYFGDFRINSVDTDGSGSIKLSCSTAGGAVNQVISLDYSQVNSSLTGQRNVAIFSNMMFNKYELASVTGENLFSFVGWKIQFLN